MNMGDTDDLGLRARKKLATREALSLAALRLALERGLDNVRAIGAELAGAIAERTGTDAERDLGPRVLADAPRCLVPASSALDRPHSPPQRASTC